MILPERASTGIPGLDKILDNLRWGDNVVWQVEQIEEYKKVVESFTNQALKDSQRVVYLRFSQHSPLLAPHPAIKCYELNANSGFDNFSSQIHSIAADEGEGVCYIFDCLSDLLSAWATDLMIGNFFKVTCPFLFELNTIAYFAIYKNMNSNQTIARIRQTTQLFLDLYRNDQQLYVHPLKVWNRYSTTMFLPHAACGEDFIPITNSSDTALLFSRFKQQGPGKVALQLDHWDRVFLHAEEMAEWVGKGLTIPESEEKKLLDQLCSMLLGRDEKILALGRQYFSINDLLEIHNRMIGSGYIGGKAVGMLLARKILVSDLCSDWPDYLEPNDSFYIGSDVFYNYLVENDCWNLRQRQKNADHYFSDAEELKQRILQGSLPNSIEDQFKQLLEYFGQSPIIVRSSSLLEDGFGNAFAGKYESIFCINQGSLEERFDNFVQAVKTVYASTMNQDALTYRLQRGLADQEEQMALLVQRVSGSHRFQYFFPDLAGVGLSYNPYVFQKDMDPKAGMIRLVLGLGTRAVDRVEDDYPRIVALDKPFARPLNTEDAKRFSQQYVDVLNTLQNSENTVPLMEISSWLTALHFWKLVASWDMESIRRRKELGLNTEDCWYLGFDKLLKETNLVQKISRMLNTLEEAYNYPVDTEFTINFSGSQEYQINLLQCRPQQTNWTGIKKSFNITYSFNDILFSNSGCSMGGNLLEKIDWIIYVEAEAYSQLSNQDKYQTARVIGRLNQIIKKEYNQPYLLMGPGRWGSTIPSLGVPVSFAEICYARVLVELAYPIGGFSPELSFGTHFFQDLVETQIFYSALFPDQENVVFHSIHLDEAENDLAAYLPEYNNWQKVIKLININRLGKELWLDADMENQKTICFFKSAITAFK